MLSTALTVPCTVKVRYNSQPTPARVRATGDDTLEVAFDDGASFRIPFEYCSPPGDVSGQTAETLGFGVCGVAASPLPGPAGNVEYFLWLRRGAPPLDPAAVDRAIEEGPA